ncbi:hypothetical protein OG978_42950 (plasmid) [Streptomyces sp. NBC_01591]|uniref:hypothetical protein n=1 Tax=Streptomyces sp. NBC_01591 TaxID=2975888 RepID=UPI002DDB7B28|nr:hypothetical protein [Streptomyces sp. NBC_01591]WSD73940.1 hypothetical protein OG978_42950 [Streptomyces sp. NBC_01591]
MKLDAITGKIQKTVVVTLAGAAIFATVQTVGDNGPGDHGTSYSVTAATLLDDPWHPSTESAPASTLDDPWHPSTKPAPASMLDDPWHPAPTPTPSD